LFKASVTIYPTKNDSVSFTSASSNEEIMKFGSEEESEHLLQILNSAQIRDRVVEKYNLLDRYDIGAQDPHKQSHLIKNYENSVFFERTKYGSIRIEVIDNDKDTASLMANTISDLVDSIKNKILRQRAGDAFRIVKRKYNFLEDEMKALNDTIEYYSKLGVVDNEVRASLLQGLANAMETRNKASQDYFQGKIAINDQYGSVYQNLVNDRNVKLAQQREMNIAYSQLEEASKMNFSHKFVIEKARAPDKKAYPVRWIIVVFATLSSLVFCIVMILVVEKIRELRIKFS